MRLAIFQEQSFWRATVGLAVAMELVTIALRIIYGQSAAEHIAATHPPLLLQLHHMFWAVPFVIVGLVVSDRGCSMAMWSISLGLIISDLSHHFLVLPLWVGNTGWHWP